MLTKEGIVYSLIMFYPASRHSSTEFLRDADAFFSFIHPNGSSSCRLRILLSQKGQLKLKIFMKE